jgi:hypothetical protein
LILTGEIEILPALFGQVVISHGGSARASTCRRAGRSSAVDQSTACMTTLPKYYQFPKK